MLHRRGVNLRFLGLILDNLSDPTSRMLVIAEAAARVIKNNIRGQLRNLSEKMKIPMEAPFRQLVVDLMNQSMSGDEKSLLFWKSQLVPELSLRFYFSDFSLRNPKSLEKGFERIFYFFGNYFSSNFRE